MSSPYISRKTVDTSYRPKGNVMSEGLKRARAPFRFRNALTGVILASFAAGVWAYSMSAVKQDDFSDIDEEAKALAAESSSSNPSLDTSNAVLPIELDAAPAVLLQPASIAILSGVAGVKPVDGDARRRPRGVLASVLEERYPRALDPATKTLVWGAPSVDSVGRIRDAWLASRK